MPPSVASVFRRYKRAVSFRLKASAWRAPCISVISPCICNLWLCDNTPLARMPVPKPRIWPIFFKRFRQFDDSRIQHVVRADVPDHRTAHGRRRHAGAVPAYRRVACCATKSSGSRTRRAHLCGCHPNPPATLAMLSLARGSEGELPGQRAKCRIKFDLSGGPSCPQGFIATPASPLSAPRCSWSNCMVLVNGLISAMP
jgi:hypothetical protein